MEIEDCCIYIYIFFFFKVEKRVLKGDTVELYIYNIVRKEELEEHAHVYTCAHAPLI